MTGRHETATVLFTDGTIIDPATLTVRFFEAQTAPATDSSPGGEPGWFFLIPAYEEWQGPFPTEHAARFEIPSGLFDVEDKEIREEYARHGFEKNRYSTRVAGHTSFSRRDGDSTIVVEEEETSLTVFYLPDGDTTLVDPSLIGIESIRSPDFRKIGVEDGKLRTVVIDPTRHVLAVIDKPAVDEHDTAGHEMAAARSALDFVSQHSPVIGLVPV